MCDGAVNSDRPHSGGSYHDRSHLVRSDRPSSSQLITIPVDILNDISSARVLVIGDVMLDRYWWGSVDRISPEAPVPIVRLEQMSLVAGGAANVAANLAGLGATPYLVGVKGTDPEGDMLDLALIEAGITNNFVAAVPDRKTTIKTRIVAHSQHVVRIDQETTEPISRIAAESLLTTIEGLLPEIDVILVSDYAKGAVSDDLLDGLAGLDLGSKPVIVDPKGRDFSRYKCATIVTPNKREAAEACGIDPALDDVANVAGRMLMQQFDLQALMVTEGEHGMTLFERDGRVTHLDALAHQVFDVTGAGDTVIATLSAAVAAGADLNRAARLANAAAGIVVGNIGTTVIRRDELADFLATHENAQYIHA